MNLLSAMRARRRLVNVGVVVFCLGLLGYALFLQYHRGLDPCPLCLFQRIAIICLTVAFALAALVADGWRVLRRIVAVLIGLVSLSGAGVAIRHLYIQSLPPGSVPSCGASLDYLWDVFPVMDVLRKVLTGSGECAKIDWTFMGLAMPAWVLIWLVILGALGALVNWPAGRPAYGSIRMR
jgi:protein dithiol:quinone oxidoreductase